MFLGLLSLLVELEGVVDVAEGGRLSNSPRSGRPLARHLFGLAASPFSLLPFTRPSAAAALSLSSLPPPAHSDPQPPRRTPATMSGYTVPPPSYPSPATKPAYGSTYQAVPSNEPLLASGSQAPRNDWGGEGEGDDVPEDFKVRSPRVRLDAG